MKNTISFSMHHYIGGHFVKNYLEHLDNTKKIIKLQHFFKNIGMPKFRYQSAFGILQPL